MVDWPSYTISNQEYVPKMYPKGNLMETILHWSFPLPQVDSQDQLLHCPSRICHAYHTSGVILPLHIGNASKIEQGLKSELWTVHNNSNSRKKSQQGHTALRSYTDVEVNFLAVEDKAKTHHLNSN